MSSTHDSKELLYQALANILDGVKATGDFVAEQLPDVVQQLFLYKTVEYGVSVVAAGTIAAYLLTAAKDRFKKAVRRKEESGSYYDAVDECSEFWLDVLTTTVGTISGLIAIRELMLLLKITLAPKVWLIEYAAALVSRS